MGANGVKRMMRWRPGQCDPASSVPLELVAQVMVELRPSSWFLREVEEERRLPPSDEVLCQFFQGPARLATVQQSRDKGTFHLLHPCAKQILSMRGGALAAMLLRPHQLSREVRFRGPRWVCGDFVVRWFDVRMTTYGTRGGCMGFQMLGQVVEVEYMPLQSVAMAESMLHAFCETLAGRVWRALAPQGWSGQLEIMADYSWGNSEHASLNFIDQYGEVAWRFISNGLPLAPSQARAM